MKQIEERYCANNPATALLLVANHFHEMFYLEDQFEDAWFRFVIKKLEAQ